MSWRRFNKRRSKKKEGNKFCYTHRLYQVRDPIRNPSLLIILYWREENKCRNISVVYILATLQVFSVHIFNKKCGIHGLRSFFHCKIHSDLLFLYSKRFLVHQSYFPSTKVRLSRCSITCPLFRILLNFKFIKFSWGHVL